jgi:hypothetical protein
MSRARRNFPPGVAHFGALVGALSRDRAEDDPDLVFARSNLCAAKLHAVILRELDRGVLRDEQRQELADLLLTHRTDDTESVTA